ncbi:MAG TPA: hypothetical protein ENK47_05155 [Euryarchaeota archaeon]|nr:hypothetical protein [Euryarchaeota archaeon]
MRRIGKLLAAFFVLMMIAVPFMSSGEVEPNDSMDFPQVLDNNETVSGELNLNWSQGEDDRDIFKIDIEKGDLSFIRVKKTDTGSGTIDIDIYDEDRELYGGNYYYGYYDSDSTLSIAGQTYTRSFIAEKDTFYFIVISGRGEYEITHEGFDVNDPNDDDVLGDSIELGDEEPYEGKVFRISSDEFEYEDSDMFHIVVDSRDDLRIKCEREGWSTGTLTVKLFKGGSSEGDLVDEATMDSGDDHIVLEDTNDDYVAHSYYILIEGEGNYTITADSNYNPFSNTEVTILLIMMLSMFCLPIAMMLIPVVIIVIVIIVIVRSQKKNKPEKKKPYRRKVK